MTRYIAFLRAINISQHPLRMTALRSSFEAIGFTQVETVGASGNVIFDAASTSAGALERRIEKRLAIALGYPVPTFIRTPAQLHGVSSAKPSPGAVKAGTEINVIFLTSPPSGRVRRAILALNSRSDELRIRGREIYWLRRPIAGTYSTIPLEKVLGKGFTTRGLRTIRRIAEKYAQKQKTRTRKRAAN